MTWKSSRVQYITITVNDKWIWVDRDEGSGGGGGGGWGCRWGIVDTVACVEYIYIFHNIKRYYARWMICLSLTRPST